MNADPKPAKRIKDPKLLAQLHRQLRDCALCGDVGLLIGLSLHHIHRHPRDDVRANLVMLCGSGTTGCHGDIEARDYATLESLGIYLRAERPDFLDYLTGKLGIEQAREWILVNLYTHVA